MSAGVVQLQAKGAQDAWFTATDSDGLSFFNQVWKKHTNFSQSVEKHFIEGTPRNGGLSTIKLSKNGDLVGHTYFSINNGSQAQDHANWEQLIESVELLIGGVVIDTQDSVFSENIAIDMFANNVSKSSNGPHPGSSATSYFYPLRFWFCEAPSLAIPLVSLQYQDVELRIRWGVAAESYQWEAYSNYYYLDDDERAAIASKAKYQMIYQVQKVIASNELEMDLTSFSHPIKFIASGNNDTASALKKDTNRIRLSVNGMDLSDFRFARPHFMDVSHYYHTNFVTSPDIFMHSFAITTSLLQPTGTLNASRVASFKIISESLPIADDIYAVSLNILKYENGMCGVLYAN